MVQITIAIICDCDDTLAPDTTAQLLTANGIDPHEFYTGRVADLVNQGYDPAIAYLNEIIRVLPSLTRDRIIEIGASLRLYPGIPNIFRELETEIQENYRNEGIHLRVYIVSGGIKDLIQASPLGEVVDKIWGCNFDYDATGKVAAIKNVVSFTEKTRFLFNIQKGLCGIEYDNQPYAVNMFIPADQRLVPYKHMIYLGDGPSDIPCMSIINANSDGYSRTIGILCENDPLRTWALGYGRRASITVPPNFTKEGVYAYNELRQTVIKMAEHIKFEISMERGGPIPRY